MEVQWFPILASVFAITLLPMVESPSLSCPPGEYFNSNICCKLCPAGTHVEEHCDREHSLGRCKSCTNGEDYSEVKNGLKECFPCHKCRSGYKMVKPCTVTKNTECQCNDGTFRPPGYEECISCKTKCPKGQVTVQRCNATADMECGLPNTELTAFKMILIFTFIAAAIGGIILYLFARCIGGKSCLKKDEEKEAETFLIPGNTENVSPNAEVSAASQPELSETSESSSVELSRGRENSSMVNLSSVPPPLQPAIPNEHSNVQRSNGPKIKIKNLYSKELEDTYFNINNMVRPRNWSTLMRKCGLSDNDIEKINCDYPNTTNEQHYQMLKTLRDRSGIADALNKIIKGLQEIGLNGIYENLVNELRRQDLVTTETEN